MQIESVLLYDGMEKFFPKSKILLTGNPVRSNLVNLISSEKSKKHFDLNPKIKTLVVLGGSLGSERINELIKSNLDLFNELDLQVLWQCGQIYFEKYKKDASNKVVIKPFYLKNGTTLCSSRFL